MGKPKVQQRKKTLMLKEKVKIIKHKDKSEYESQGLAEKFFIRKFQILQVLHEFETNEPLSKQRSAHITDNEEINELIMEWFKDMSQRKLPISGPMLQEKALQFGKDLGNTEFKASNGWFENFYKHNNIAFYVKRGENADIDIAIVEHWKKNFQLF